MYFFRPVTNRKNNKWVTKSSLVNKKTDKIRGDIISIDFLIVEAQTKLGKY